MSFYGKLYPWLRLRNLYSGEIDTESDAMDDMPDGWRVAFGSMMCEELDAAIKKAGLEDKFIFEQIKEKYGELRMYYSPYNREIDDTIWKYTALSRNICIHCGKPDVPMLDTNWAHPSCRDCYNKIEHHKHITYEQAATEQTEMTGVLKMRDYNADTKKWVVDREIDIHETADMIRKEYSRRIKKPDFTEHTGEPEWN